MAKPITKEGYEKVKAKLTELKAEFETLPAIIAEAREKGDLKENAEYHAAKEKQAFIEFKINELSKMTGREVSEENQKKIIDTVINDNVPKDIDKMI